MKKILPSLAFLAATSVAIASDSDPYRFKTPNYQSVHKKDLKLVQNRANKTQKLANKILENTLENAKTKCYTDLGSGKSGFESNDALYITCTSILNINHDIYTVNLTVMKKEGRIDFYDWSDPKTADHISISNGHERDCNLLGTDDFLDGRLDNLFPHPIKYFDALDAIVKI